jgi:arsenate reductase
MKKPLNILILCTGNSARSILAEALFNTLGKDYFHAFSAGSQPTGRVNPFAAEIAEEIGYPAAALRSKSWDEFASADAPVMDIVITVCDSAAGEACPLWHGAPIKAHWGFPDPAAATGGDAEKRQAFRQVFAQILQRVALLLEQPLDTLDKTALKAVLDGIGRS